MAALPPIEDLLRWQRGYYEMLTAWEQRPWGVVGLCLDNPSSHDSNHAYASCRLTPRRFCDVLAEAEAWFTPHGIKPRVRFHIPPNDPDLVSLGETMGWRSRFEQETWRAWPCRSPLEDPPSVPDMAIHVVGDECLEDLVAVQAAQRPEAAALRIERVWARLSADPNTTCLLACLRGEPAAALCCVWRQSWGSVESVETREPYRRRGLCTALIRVLQRLAFARGARGLYLYDVEEAPDRLYARLGFEQVARLQQVSLWLEGPRRA